jgi:hypothetical protein
MRLSQQPESSRTVFEKTIKFPNPYVKDPHTKLPVMEEEVFYFNFTMADVADLQTRFPGGMAGMLSQVFDTKDERGAYETFSMLLLEGIGRRDGVLHVKDEEVKARFKAHPAFNIMFEELLSDDGLGIIEYLKAAMPAEFAKMVATEERKREEADSSGRTDSPGPERLQQAQEAAAQRQAPPAPPQQ